ncbi:MAG: A24 family peptidase [Desulfuromonadia bacterium]
MSFLLLWIIVFFVGASVGSFLNVCIYRIPAGRSVVSPPSSCPACGNRIRWHDNLPVLGWFLLRGRCRDCSAPISLRYPLVEALCGALTVALLLRFGISFTFLSFWTLTMSLVVVTFIDLDHQIIPDLITLPGIAAGFLSSFLLPWLSWKSSLLGILLGGGVLLAIANAYELVTKKEGMGGGDVKLLAMMGAFLGWKSIPFILFASSLVGSLIGLILMRMTKSDGKLAIPFGPFLSLGALIYLFCGKEIITWYFSLFG